MQRQDLDSRNLVAERMPGDFVTEVPLSKVAQMMQQDLIRVLRYGWLGVLLPVVADAVVVEQQREVAAEPPQRG